MRRTFAISLHKEMSENKDIYLVTGDLGYGMLDKIRDDFRDRFINAGAAEQTMMNIGIGLALSGKIPVVYSITPFLIYRPFEAIRLYVDHEKIPVKMIGGGRDRDYLHDNFSHWAEDVPEIMSCFKNIQSYYPETTEEIGELTHEILYNNQPTFLSLTR